MNARKKLVFLGLLLLAGVAAAESKVVTPDDVLRLADATPSSDWSRRIWEALFGEFAKNPLKNLGTPTTLLGQLFLVFNGCMFAVGTAWLTWGILVGVVGTAHDGEALGKRISSAWYPVRAVVGITGMTPVLGGFTLWQGLLMAAATVGIGIANSMWSTAVSSQSLTQLVGTASITGAPAIKPSEVAETIEGMFRSNVCLAKRRHEAVYQEVIGLDLGAEHISLDTRVQKTENGYRIVYGSAIHKDSCGSVSVALERARGDAFAFRTAAVDYQKIRNSVADTAGQKLVAADAMVSGLAEQFVLRIDGPARAAAAAWQAGRSPDMRSLSQSDLFIDQAAQEEMRKIVSDYVAGIRRLIDSSVEKSGSSITAHARARMSDGGWLNAGSWHSAFAEANAALADAVSGIKLSAQYPHGQLVSAEVADRVNRLDWELDQIKALALEFSGNDTINSAISSTMRDMCAGQADSVLGTQTGNCSLGQSIVSRVINATFNGSGGGSAASGAIFAGTGVDAVGLVNPVIAFKNLGDYVQTLGVTLVSTSFVAEKAAAKIAWAASTAAKWAGMGGSAMGVPGAQAVAAAGTAGQTGSAMIESITTVAVPLGWMLLVLGAFLGIYIPFIPFVVWTGAILTYITSFIEGLIAMPLHSMAHLHTEGEGMGPASTKGYLFFLNSLTRPPIMVLAFFIASALSIVMATLVAHTFLPAMASVQGNSITGISSIIALLALYGLINVIIVQSSFQMIDTIPDQVISYMGAGELRGGLGKDTQSKINSLFVAASRGGMGALQGSAAAKGALDKERSKREQQGQR